jgi:hypothetical protein
MARQIIGVVREGGTGDEHPPDLPAVNLRLTIITVNDHHRMITSFVVACRWRVLVGGTVHQAPGDHDPAALAPGV